MNFKIKNSKPVNLLIYYQSNCYCQVITAPSIEKASRIIDLVNLNFNEIGLSVNPDKSVGILIKEGKLEND
jgi:hypothetical protein